VTKTSFRDDFMALTKARLSALVVVTTFFGYWAGSLGSGFSWITALHVLFGATLAALASGVFNQLMEVDADALMDRTADRPLPSRRMKPEVAFAIGTVLASLGVIHLGRMVNFEAAAVAALTLAVYLFLYTPLKRRSGWNTVVGAVAGALPPLIGWVGAFGLDTEGFRWELFQRGEAFFLFALLFLWQLPHFFAIHWLHREQYRKGGFVMWAHGDENGRLTSVLALGTTAALMALMFQPWLGGFTHPWFVPLGLLLTGWLLWLALRFRSKAEPTTARKLFFGTLIYLPLILLALVAAWIRKGAPGAS